MQESADKKVLLKISNLKQYFPVGHGLFNKANDGISLDIYEGEVTEGISAYDGEYTVS